MSEFLLQQTLLDSLTTVHKVHLIMKPNRLKVDKKAEKRIKDAMLQVSTNYLINRVVVSP